MVLASVLEHDGYTGNPERFDYLRRAFDELRF